MTVSILYYCILVWTVAYCWSSLFLSSKAFQCWMWVASLQKLTFLSPCFATLQLDFSFSIQLHYISPNLGVGGSASPTAFTSVFGYIGTPPQLRRQSRLTWRQGPAHLLEDVVTASTVKNIYTLGPTYIGSFQSPYLGELSWEIVFRVFMPLRFSESALYNL